MILVVATATLAALVLPQPPSAPAPFGSAPAPLPAALVTQVMLDRGGFSPGPIDGRMGKNTRRALVAFQQQNGSEPTASEPAVAPYTITPEDTQGPFAEAIPEDMVEKSKLQSLGYTSILEALAERFHSTPALLQQLNPGATFEAGSTIQVPNVQPLTLPVQPPPTAEAAERKAANGQGTRPTGTSGAGAAAVNGIARRPDILVTVKRSSSDLTVTDASGRIVMYAPVTTGSENDPLPIGEWKVNGVQLNPKFHYNPNLFWDADPNHSKATLAPGPNNPVGVVWIDINKPHYGIHGTPEPATIGRTESHGCVRLTNWDALKLAGLVKPGTRVVFAP